MDMDSPELHTFSYDPFQKSAIDALYSGASVLVAAPTGAGKTVIADHVIDIALASGKHVIYTAPIKALSNQKYRDFSKVYGDLVGIITGDVAINPDAPIRIIPFLTLTRLQNGLKTFSAEKQL